MPVALVASVGAAGTGSTATTAGIDTTGCTFLVAAIPSGTASSVTDSKGNTWLPLTSYGANPFIRMFYARNPTVGTSHTFTGTATAGFPSIVVMGFSGVATGYPFGCLSQVGATGKVPGSLTPLENNEVIVSALSDNSAATSYAIDSGMTLGPTVQFVAATAYGVAFAYKVQTAAAANNPTWTASGANNSSTQASFRSDPVWPLTVRRGGLLAKM